MLRFAEELLILLLDEDSGASVALPDRTLNHALAGAVLMDLEREGRIDTDPARLILVDPTPVDDDLLDPILAEIAAAARSGDAPTGDAPSGQWPHAADYWVSRAAAHAPAIRERALARLVRRGILDADDDGSHALSRPVSRSRRYPLAGDGAAVQEIRLRIMGILFSSDIPTPEDAAIIGLADACGIFEFILTSAERAPALPRIRAVGQLFPIARAVAQAIASAPEPAADAPAEPRPGPTIPRARGLPVIGSARSLMTDTMPFLLRQYRRHGPVFEVRALHRKIIVLAGADANRLMQRHGKVHFRSLELWRNLHTDLDVAHSIVSVDGAEHSRYRRALRPAYSRERLERRIDAAAAIARREIAHWPAGPPVRAVPALKRIAAEQMAVITANTPALEYQDDLTVYMDFLLGVRVFGRYPGFLLKLPRVRRARRRLQELYDKAMAVHQTNPNPDGETPARNRDGGDTDAGDPDLREPDIIDAILELHRADPQLLPETDLWLASMAPFIVGIDTVPNTLAFILYGILKTPELQEQVRAEADALFADAAPDCAANTAEGSRAPTAAALRNMDVTHRAIMEAMRLYPVAGLAFRTVANSFDFAGHRIPAGARVLLATALPHYLPEHFPDPERFDIDRYAPGRMEQARPGVYAPFGLGPHTCLGNGFAQAQLMLTIAAIFHDAELALHPPGYNLKTVYTPVLAPERRFAFRVIRHRRRYRPA